MFKLTVKNPDNKYEYYELNVTETGRVTLENSMLRISLTDIDLYTMIDVFFLLKWDLKQ